LVVLYAEDRLSAIVKEAALPVLAAGAVVALVVLLVTTVLTHRIVRPIQLLGDRAAAIAGGDFTAVDVPRCDDEICDLTLSINRMTEQLGRYETEVRRSERLRTLGQLGAGMAHQLRNAAAGATMAVELHQRKCSEAADSESLDVAIRQLKLMESYLERFLTLGRPRPTKHEKVVLQSVVADVLSLVQPACRHAKIDLSFQEPPQPICVEGDYELLRQLLVNLLLNAVEAAEREGQGRIVVELDAAPDGRAVLSVQDTGPGPAAATKEELFEPFVTEKPDGTGLGLYVARQVVQEHGGSIAWHRRGGMTCFDVELPLLQS
jgi:signal transduction histidine kinase